MPLIDLAFRIALEWWFLPFQPARYQQAWLKAQAPGKGRELP